MAIGIASDVNLEKEAEERRKRLAQQQMRNPQHAPMPTQEKSAGSRMVDLATNTAMNKVSDKYMSPLMDKGMAKVTGMFSPAAAPSAAQFAGLKAAAPLATGATTGAGIAPGMAQAVLGSSSAAAPLVAQTAGMTGAGLAGTTASGLGASAATGAAGAAGGMAPMLAALGPVGMAIGAGLLLKKFGMFSKGGHVGPLYSAEGDKVDAAQAVLNSILEQKKKKEAKKDQSFLDRLAGVEYNAVGGTTGLTAAGTPDN